MRPFRLRLCVRDRPKICTSSPVDKSPSRRKRGIGWWNQRKILLTFRSCLCRYLVRIRTEAHCSAWTQKGRKCLSVSHQGKRGHRERSGILKGHQVSNVPSRMDSRKCAKTHSEPKSHFPEPANLQQRSTSSRTFAQRLPLLEPRCAFFSSLESFRLSAAFSFVFLGEPSSMGLPSCLRFCTERLVPSSVEASSTWGCKLSAVEMRNLSRWGGLSRRK